MLRQKERVFKDHIAVSLEDLVPKDNFYRHVEAKLDLSFVRELVQDCYSSRMGRPSIDPVVFFKLQLIMFFEGIRSERQLMDMAAMRLDHRWYIGYDLDEKVPDHSSLSKIRDRYGLETFLAFFDKIVEMCIEAGLVWGEELYLDGTKIRANAAIDGMVDRWYWEAQQHIQKLFEQEQVSVGDAEAPTSSLPPEKPASIPSRLVEKYNGERLTGRRTKTYERTTDKKVSPTDPDATPMKRSNSAKAELGYHLHYVVDGGKARIILAALVTPSSIMDNTPMLDLVRQVRFRWKLIPEFAAGDAKYGTVANIVGLEQDGLKAYVPVPDHSQRTDFYPPDKFHYDAERDIFICPQGHDIPLHKHSYSENEWVYRSDAKTCDACPVKSECTKSKSGRHLRRSFFQEYLDRNTDYHETEAYKKAMRKRQVWVEPLFGEAKQWHQLEKFRLRRLQKVNIQGVLTAAGQNLKRLLSFRGWGRRFGPSGWSVVLALPVPSLVSSVFGTIWHIFGLNHPLSLVNTERLVDFSQ